MSHYVDGFVLPVKKERLAEYQAISEAASKIFKEHGALEYWECVGDDLDPDGTGKFTNFADAANDETVIFGWSLYESREARDAANEKIKNDSRLLEMLDLENPLFENERMAYGGFNVIVRK